MVSNLENCCKVCVCLSVCTCAHMITFVTSTTSSIVYLPPVFLKKKLAIADTSRFEAHISKGGIDLRKIRWAKKRAQQKLRGAYKIH